MKKGESAITFVFSLFLLVIVLTIFYVLFLQAALSKAEIAIKQVGAADIQITLINYLKTPLKDNKNVYELIINSYYNDNYNELEKVTEDIFNKVYNKENCPLWNVYGEIDNKKFFDFESEFDIRKYSRPTPRGNILSLFIKDTISTRSTSLDLIFPDKNKKIKITLIEGCVNE